MTDESNVTASSENTGEYVPEETSTEATSAEATTATAETVSDASQDASASTAVDAVGEGSDSTDATATTEAGTDSAADATAIDPNASRTGYVTDAKSGDECVCPDGRKGTVHKFDNGLVCIPNADQA